MTDRPILFSAPMIKALLAGVKTQTRRTLNPQPNRFNGGLPLNDGRGSYSIESGWKRYPIAAGDRLWVKERLQRATTDQDVEFVSYYADHRKPDWITSGWPWKNSALPSIHMPKIYSRLTLHVHAARVQRLQDISEEDATAEGVYAVQSTDKGFEAVPYYRSMYGSRDLYKMLWEVINGEGSWDQNPWVAAYSFMVETNNIASARAT